MLVVGYVSFFFGRNPPEAPGTAYYAIAGGRRGEEAELRKTRVGPMTVVCALLTEFL